LDGGYAVQCTGKFQGEGGWVLARFAPSSSTVRSLLRIINEQAMCSSWMTQMNKRTPL